MFEAGGEADLIYPGELVPFCSGACFVQPVTFDEQVQGQERTERPSCQSS